MKLDYLKRWLLSLLILSCSFVFAQDRVQGELIAFVSKVGEIERDLVVVTPQGKEQARLDVRNAERDLRVLSHAGYLVVLQDFWDDTLFLFDARSGELEPVALPPDFFGTPDPVASAVRYILFAKTFDHFLLDVQRATLRALEVEGSAHEAVLSPDGQFVFMASVTGLWQLPTRDPTKTRLVDEAATTSARFVDETAFVYLADGNVLKRASTRKAATEVLAQDVVRFYPTGDSVLFSTSEGGLYSLELTSLTSGLVHPFTEPAEIVWADADHALVTTREDGLWFYVTLATGELLTLSALDGTYLVAGLSAESDAALFSDTLVVGDPHTFWGLELRTGKVTRIGDFPNGLTRPGENGGVFLSVFDRARPQRKALQAGRSRAQHPCLEP